MSKYAIYYQDLFWGIGDTPEEALEDAKQWTGAEYTHNVYNEETCRFEEVGIPWVIDDNVRNYECGYHQSDRAEYCIVSDKLAKLIHDVGGYVEHYHYNHMFITEEEYEDCDDN